jgi:hypothetical protein
MTGPDQRAATANVLFVRWRAAAASEDTRSRGLRAFAEALVADWKDEERAVLEGPHGLAVVASVPASVAWESARRAARDDKGVAVALHRGPIQVIPDPVSRARITGEAIDTAAALAAESGKERLRASPAFRAALRAQGQPRRALLRTVFGLVGIAVLLGAGIAGRHLRKEYEAARRPATIQLEIRPWGEVLVDGELKGVSPPLVKLSVPPGPHTIEVRNGRLKPMYMEVQVQPGEELELKHVFEAPPVPKPVARRAASAPVPAPPQNLLDRLKDRAERFGDKAKALLQ